MLMTLSFDKLEDGTSDLLCSLPPTKPQISQTRHENHWQDFFVLTILTLEFCDAFFLAHQQRIWEFKAFIVQSDFHDREAK